MNISFSTSQNTKDEDGETKLIPEITSLSLYSNRIVPTQQPTIESSHVNIMPKKKKK